MMIQALLTSMLLLFFLRVSVASPLDGIEEFSSTYYTTAYCQSLAPTGTLVAGRMDSDTGPQAVFCGCIPYTQEPGSFNSVCGGGSSTSACLQTTAYSSKSTIYNTTCVSCKDTQSCENYVITDLMFDSTCSSSGLVLLIAGSGETAGCACSTPADIASAGE